VRDHNNKFRIEQEMRSLLYQSCSRRRLEASCTEAVRTTRTAPEIQRSLMPGARRSRIEPFQRAAAMIREHAEGTLAYVTSGLSNGRT
jgi:transposase